MKSGTPRTNQLTGSWTPPSPPKHVEVIKGYVVDACVINFFQEHGIRENIKWHIKCHMCCFIKYKEGRLGLVFGDKSWQLFFFFPKLKCTSQD